MPDPMTLSGLPLTVPVKPSIPRTSVIMRASAMSISAMRWARLGSPGMRTAGAKSPGAAAMCGVAMGFLSKGVLSTGWNCVQCGTDRVRKSGR